MVQYTRTARCRGLFFVKRENHMARKKYSEEQLKFVKDAESMLHQLFVDARKQHGTEIEILTVTALLREVCEYYPAALENPEVVFGLEMKALYEELQASARERVARFREAKEDLRRSIRTDLQNHIHDATERIISAIAEESHGDEKTYNSIMCTLFGRAAHELPDLAHVSELQAAVSRVATDEHFRRWERQLGELFSPENAAKHQMPANEAKEWAKDTAATTVLLKQIEALLKDTGNDKILYLVALSLLELVIQQVPHIVTTKVYFKIVMGAVKTVGGQSVETLGTVSKALGLCERDCATCAVESDTGEPEDATDTAGPVMGWALPDEEPES